MTEYLFQLTVPAHKLSHQTHSAIACGANLGGTKVSVCVEVMNIACKYNSPMDWPSKEHLTTKIHFPSSCL